MKKLWLSYSWKDNVDSDVDFIANRIQSRGIEVKQDRFVLISGKRLWDQIAHEISDRESTDAWAVFLTNQSLQSEAVKEEIFYALDRAISTRGGNYPLIAITQELIELEQIPLTLRSRLFISISDSDWLERVVSGVNQVPPRLTRGEVSPVFYNIENRDDQFVIEIRPRAGRWYPAFVGVEEDDYPKIKGATQAPSGGLVGMSSMSQQPISCELNKKQYHGIFVNHNITSINSIYIFCKEIPKTLAVGPKSGPLYLLEF